MTTKKQWRIRLKHGVTGKTKVVFVPGGLHEAEARRHAILKAGGGGWLVLSAHLTGPITRAGFDRNVDLCCRSA